MSSFCRLSFCCGAETGSSLSFFAAGMADVCRHTCLFLQRAQKVSHDWSSPVSDLDWHYPPSLVIAIFVTLFCCRHVTLATSEPLFIFGLEPSSLGFSDVHTVTITISAEGWRLSGFPMIIMMNTALFNWSWTYLIVWANTDIT